MLSVALNKQFIKAYLVREDGQAMAEYGIILALIAVVVAAAVLLLGQQISAALGSVTTALQNAVGG
jgi:pilus assembly protein Flp/PilA